MKQLFLIDGKVALREVPLPTPGPDELLVKTFYSAISSGTETSSVQKSRQSLVVRALKEPENVRRALEYARSRGTGALVNRIRGDVSIGSSSGYSLSGVVVAVGHNVQGFRVGERVSVAGAGVANHAEFVSAPVNLCVKIPAGVEHKDACTATIGAIALQSVRRLNPSIAETIVVVGLGLLGQLVSQILRANGCRVVGIDTNDTRVAEAAKSGVFVAFNPKKSDVVAEVTKLTDGFGADGVIIAAASQSNSILEDAMKISRKKGRIVVLGDVGLKIRRDLMYEKELDLLMSTSYGPGRYDPDYEERGLDYPLPYVRWTLARNMGAFLDLLALGAVRLDFLSTDEFSFGRAKDAFDALANPDKPVALALLRYDGESEPVGSDSKAEDTVSYNGYRYKTSPETVRVAVVGASSFALATHLPILKRMRNKFELVTICSRKSTSAESVRLRFGFERATTNIDDILKDDSIDLVIIATRHDLHGNFAKQFLEAGKHVFLEKPLTLVEADVEDFGSRTESKELPLLFLGYNRRFAPATLDLLAQLSRRKGPITVNYRVNAGKLPEDHWVYGPEGGGRNIGEACHFYDFFIALTNSLPAGKPAVTASNVGTHLTDGFSVSIQMLDGSLCNLVYFSNGSSKANKERIEVSWDSKSFVVDDFRTLQSLSSKRSKTHAKQNKGFQRQWEEVYESVLSGVPPIPLHQIIAASNISFEVEKALRGEGLPDFSTGAQALSTMDVSGA